MMRSFLAAVLISGLGLLSAGAVPALAQDDYPNRPVRILVGFAPGGATDVLARALAQELSKTLNQSFVVENKAGANGALAAQDLARSAPDGYTLMVTAGAAMTINVHIPPKPRYDTLKDFQPISQLVANDGVLAVGNDVPIKTFEEFVAYAKANPDELSYGVSGIGSPTHLGMELLKESLGITIANVPYKGDAQVAVDVIAGTLPVGIMALPSVVGQLKDGQMRPIAVLGDSRYDDFADIPNIAELGHPDNLIQTWLGLVGPAGMPDAVVQKVSEATQAAMQGEAITALMKTQNSRIVASQPDEFKAYIAEEHKKWGDVVARVDLSAR